MGDYGFRSEVELRYSKSEQFILREVVAKAENQLDDAILFLEEKIEPKSKVRPRFCIGFHVLSKGASYSIC